jgi:hypothetical protein
VEHKRKHQKHSGTWNIRGNIKEHGTRKVQPELDHKEHGPSGEIRNMEHQGKLESVKNKEWGTQRTGSIREHKEHETSHGTPETSEKKTRNKQQRPWNISNIQQGPWNINNLEHHGKMRNIREHGMWNTQHGTWNVMNMEHKREDQNH